MARVRVGNIIEDGRIAGPQLRILSVASALNERDIETVVIHPIQDSEKFSERLEKAGIAHRALPIQRLARGLSALGRYLLRFPVEIILLRQLLMRERFDFLHCSGGFWQVKGLIAAKLSRTRAIWHMNDTVLPERLRPLFLFACRHFAYKLIFAGTRVREHYLNGVSIDTPFIDIQAPVDCRKFDPAAVVAEAMLAATGAINVVTVANVNPLKGLEYFVGMAGNVSRKAANVRYYIVGPVFDSQREYFGKLQKQIASQNIKNVFFYGPTDDVPGILKAADIYVCSSTAEASPTSVWEAMAMGKPIVSSDVGDVARFTEASGAGIVAPVGNASALADALATYLEDPDRRKRSGLAARRTAMEQLDLSICVAAHERAYT